MQQSNSREARKRRKSVLATSRSIRNTFKGKSPFSENTNPNLEPNSTKQAEFMNECFYEVLSPLHVKTSSSRFPLSDVSNVYFQETSNSSSEVGIGVSSYHCSLSNANSGTPNTKHGGQSSLNNGSITPSRSMQNRVTKSSNSTISSITRAKHVSNGINTPVGNSISKFPNLSSYTDNYSARNGKHKAKLINTKEIPNFNFSFKDDESYLHAVQKVFGISKDYFDNGDPTFICHRCGAMLWHAESLRGNQNGSNNAYSLCCGKGKVQLPKCPNPPQLLSNLFRNKHPKSKNFIKNIRAYNMMFSFTSMGGKVDSSVNKGRGPYVYRLQGQNYHLMGSLLPVVGSTPKFSQLYIYDTENEVSNRKNAIRSGRDLTCSNDDAVDPQVINDIKNLLDSCNPLVISYRMARDRFTETNQQNVKLKLIGRREKDGRMHNLPSASEVAGIIIGDIDASFDKRDVVVETQSGLLKRISELHPSYLALQYPLIFPAAQDCYRIGIKHRGIPETSKTTRTDVTMREFFAYIIQDRVNEYSLLLDARKLFQQFLVDAYTMIESQRLSYIRNQQKKLRCDSYRNLTTAMGNGSTNASDIGKPIIIVPSSFTGGSRYMIQNYMDAMAICKWFGYPDLFITVTCNPKWPEITRFLNDKDLNPEDRPEVLCRNFKMKLDQMIEDFKKDKLFGGVKAVIYTVEFQKRGLPHAHICIFLDAKDKFPSVEDIDRVICAEIPDKENDPQLFQLVSDFMIHGPCGVNNPTCPCMRDGKCSKRYPRDFANHTSLDEDGYPIYRRRDNGYIVEKGGVALDNRYVVPYNSLLLKRYQAHINVEWCNQSGAIKYLFKYINKGPDRVTAAVYEGDNDGSVHGTEAGVDEIKEYYNCRYISACEATWRIFSFDIHYRYPSVQRLSFHLPGEQNIVYEEDDDLCDVLNKPTVGSSMFMGWMECNKVDAHARTLTYVEFPMSYVWNISSRKWTPRKQRMCIGRIHYVPISTGDSYYLRVLLNKVRGPTSHEDIRTVKGILYPSYKEACYALGLLDDDKEYVEAIEEASKWATAASLRSCFVRMLLSNTLSKPDFVWTMTWKYLSDDVLYKQRIVLKKPALQLEPEVVKNLALFEIEQLLRRNGSTLRNMDGMPYPDNEYILSSTNRLIHDELAYDKDLLEVEHDKLLKSLTDEQKTVYESVMSAVEMGDGGMFFLYGYGGTGKTFIWKTLSAALRSKGEIVLNVASSGIAALLLSGGRTAHSRFAIPINIHEESFCSVKPNSDLAALIRKAILIIWDEAPMIHKHCFEALDRTLRDILRLSDPSNEEKLFGGKVVVFGGDFRQILPVIPKGSRHDIVNASLNSSYLWDHCRVLKLTVNMRLQVGSLNSDLDEIKEFGEWILKIGNGTIGESNDSESIVEIPNDILIKESTDPVGSIISFVYPNVIQKLSDHTYFQDKAILAPTHEVVDVINDRVLSMIPGDENVYLSSDSICESDQGTDTNAAVFSPDFLNSLKFSGLPNHKLILKVGVIIMLLRNIDQPNGLCNGTRLQVVRLDKHVIEAKIITGSNIGDTTLITRQKMNPSDKRIPFKVVRRQFPIAVCFAMTINKSQGQSLARVGLFLPRPVFTHGQLYVAVSRVKSKKGLKVLVCDNDGKLMSTTTNVVYKEVLQNL